MYNYVDAFLTQLEQKYNRELTSAGLTTEKAIFLNAKTIKIPRLDLAGYKDHARSGGWNRQAVANDFEVKVLTHDRDVEFFVDVMDVDETNAILSAANITSNFVTEQAIPEMDKYRYSKLYSDYTTLGKSVNTTVPTADNVLLIYDSMMENMDEAEVPGEGRILYVTPAIYKLLKQADQIRRVMGVQQNNGVVSRVVRQLDDVELVKVPSSRMKSAYDFSDGVEDSADAVQIHMILVHPRSVLAPIKHTAIYLWPPGSHTEGDGYLYQNRSYTDLFLIERKADGVQINAVGAADSDDEDDDTIANLVFICEKGTETGKTKVTVIAPAKGAANSYIYKVGGTLPKEGASMADAEGWAAYTLGADIVAAKETVVAIVEIDASNKAVRGGTCVAEPA